MFFLSVTAIYGGGFQLNEHGAKPMGLGGAFTAIANDASAVYWNGAGLSFLNGTNLLLGASLIAPGTTFRGVSPSTDISYMKNQIFYPPHFFASYKLSDDFSIGTGLSVPFGLGTEWNEDWIGRYLALKTDLMVFSAPLVVSWSILDNLSISAGGSYSFANVTITQKNPQFPFSGDAFIKLEGDDNSSFGYNFGIMWKPTRSISIGGSFRSEVNYNFEGTATSTGADQVSASLPAGDISAELTTPMNIQGGIAVWVIEQVRLSADFQWVGWSSYEKLAVDFNDPKYEDISRPRLYDDSYIIRLGGEYYMDENISLLAGIYFDKNPVDPQYLSPSLPESDRIGLSIGVDARLYENFGFTGSFLFIRSKELTIDNSTQLYTPGGSPLNGTYNSKAGLFAATFYYSFN